MSFEIPRLRVLAAKISQNYTDFLKKPLPFLNGLTKDLANVNPELAGAAAKLINTGEPELAALDAFIQDLRIFLAANADASFNPDEEVFLSKSVKNIKGVGDKLFEVLDKFGVSTARDLLYAVPFRYEALTAELSEGKAVLSGAFMESKIGFTRQKKRIFQAVFKSDAGFFTGIWMHFNASFPSGVLHAGNIYHLYGSVTSYNGMPAIFHPELLEDDEIGKVRPVYSVPGKISQKVYGKLALTAIKEYLPYVNESLPEVIRYKYRYPDIQDAIYTLHKPESVANARLILQRQHPALRRLIYEELFYLQLRLFMRKKSYMKNQGIEFDIPKAMLEDIAKLMPFKMTEAQRQAVREIYADMRTPSQMNRLLQGDVGSGKTIVAFVSALVAVKNGYQAVILAPTEVLAEQHYRNLLDFLKGTYHACLLTGSVKASEKKQIKEAIAAGDIGFIVGTHAIIQEDVEFHNLGFAVIDEQHRFGVKQRKALMDKGDKAPDILLMTATPIPRTLALTFYGDLDLSEIAEMPPRRIPPLTKVFREEKLKDAYAYVREHLHKGDRAYFVYPAIEESEKTKLKAATSSVETVKKFFPDKNVGLLHGRLKADEKRRLLDDFASGALDILVSTTVVEVGVDVKDATVVVVENADHFGLAQLHQLRGRVGRNSKQSYCVLVASEELSDTGMKRLRAMENNTNGFRLAEIDLELRGQGDFIGVRQSGMPEFRFADIIKDSESMREARRDAEEIINEDPFLQKPKNVLIKSVLVQRWQDEYEYFLVG